MKSIDDILNLVTGTSNDGSKKEILSELDNDRQAKEEFTKIKNAWALAATGRKMPDYRVEQLYLDFQKQLNSKRKTIGLFPMEEVIPRLQRRYNIEIDVASPVIYQSVFTATLKNETLEEVFRSIGFACSVQYQIIKGEDLNAKTKVSLYKR